MKYSRTQLGKMARHVKALMVLRDPKAMQFLATFVSRAHISIEQGRHIIEEYSTYE